MMILSNHTIESLGFSPIREGQPIEAAFLGLHVFEATGFTLEDDAPVVLPGEINGTRYQLAVCNSVNVASTVLLGDLFTDDEEGWVAEHKCRPPYLVVQLGPTAMHRATTGHFRMDGNGIVTYNSFATARAELKQIETALLPSIEMALACVLGPRDPPVEWTPVDQAVFGVTPAKQTVHDLYMSGSARLCLSKPIAPAVMRGMLADATTLASSLEARVARFYHLGMRDRDDLKKFFYYFLAIEIEVHRTFKKSTKSQHLANAATVTGRVGHGLQHLLEARDNWTALADRFVWCVASTWVHLSDKDVREFRTLKRVRDDIAHGNIAVPPASAVKAVEALAKRIHA